jgi:hypothetical protein
MRDDLTPRPALVLSTKKPQVMVEMGRPRSTKDLVCPDCGRDFSKERYGTTAYKKHMGRRNPCTRLLGSEGYIKAMPAIRPVKRNNMEELSTEGLVAPTSDSTCQALLCNILDQLFARDENKSMVLKTHDYRNKIYVKKENKVVVISHADTVRLVLLGLHYRVFPILKAQNWPHFPKLEDYIWKTTCVYLDDMNWRGELEERSIYFGVVSTWLKTYFKQQVHRKHELKCICDSIHYREEAQNV